MIRWKNDVLFTSKTLRGEWIGLVIGWHQEDDAWRAVHLRDRTSAVVETELVVRLESGAVAPRITTTTDAQNTALRAVINKHKV